MVSALHTAHFAAFFRRSAEIDRLAFSNSSADTGTVGSPVLKVWPRFGAGADFAGGTVFRFILKAIRFYYRRICAAPQLLGYASRLRLGLGCLRELYHYRHVKRRAATRTALPGSHAGGLLFVLPFDAGRHSVRTNRAKHVALGVVNNWRFHTVFRSPLHPTLSRMQELFQNRKEL